MGTVLPYLVVKHRIVSISGRLGTLGESECSLCRLVDGGQISKIALSDGGKTYVQVLCRYAEYHIISACYNTHHDPS